VTDVVIASAVRTPIGKFQGALSGLTAPQLGSHVIRHAVQRAGLQAGDVQEVILGCVLTAGVGQAPARQASRAAGIPDHTSALTVNKVCGSGLKAVVLATQAIKCGDAEVIVAGGMESMTNSPYLLPDARAGMRLGHSKVIDSMIIDGLWDPYYDTHMGLTAEAVCQEYAVDRSAQDAWALESHRRALAAQKAGHFKQEIAPIEMKPKKGDPWLFDTDEGPRADVTAEGLAKLRPAFDKNGLVTAGNSSTINDGAAALVVMSEAKAKELKLTPLAKIRSYASAGVDPSIMGMGPWPASEKALKKAGLRREEIDLWELNEAFAGQSLGVLRELHIPKNRVNVNGGAIALGQPIGASGARVLTTLLYAMQDRDAKLGVASLCIGGGQGIAMVVERS